MREQHECPKVQDAAICAIIDVLDDNLEGEFSLRGSEEAAEARSMSDMPDALMTVSASVRAHRSFQVVQYRGCHALGLLYGLLPPGFALPAEVLDTVLGALWRCPNDLDTAAGACFALRAFLEPRAGATSEVSAVLDMLRAREAGPDLMQVLEHFAE
ncbi:unnamed protein product, partial [Prorocentrum cordatum]